MKTIDEKKQKPLSDPPNGLSVAVLMRHFSRTAGGAESYAVQLVENLCAKHRITVFAQSFGPEIAGVRYVRVPFFKPLPRWMNQIWYAIATWWLSRTYFDVVHSHENVWHAAVHTIHVKTVHANVAERSAKKGRVSTWLKTYTSPRMLTYLSMERSRLKLSRYVIFASDGLKQEVLRCFHRNDRNFILTPGVSIPDTQIAVAENRCVRAEFGLEPHHQIVLFVANDFKKKGLDTLLDAIYQIRLQGNHAVHLLIAGRGTQDTHYKRHVNALGLDTNVHFLGIVSDMNRLYEVADCLAHPTTQDVFPMVVLEAMAHQLPVITTCAPWNSMSNLLSSGTNALLISNPLDANALCIAITTCLNDVDLNRTLRFNGLVFAKQYQWSNIAAMQTQIYEQARGTR